MIINETLPSTILEVKPQLTTLGPHIPEKIPTTLEQLNPLLRTFSYILEPLEHP
jgi:hypothetical protein